MNKMGKFMWMTRPNKPSQDGQLTRDLWCCISITDFNLEVEKFMKEHTHVRLCDISIEFDPYEYEVTLEAAGKSHIQYEKEMVQYKKEMKAYKLWQLERADDIIAFKEAEKKRIAKAKLNRTKERLAKEIAAVEAKLEKA
jgi:hypothetical protein